MFHRTPKKSVPPQNYITDVLNIDPDESKNTMMHDVNIEEMMKTKMLIMALRECNVSDVITIELSQ